MDIVFIYLLVFENQSMNCEWLIPFCTDDSDSYFLFVFTINFNHFFLLRTLQSTLFSFMFITVVNPIAQANERLNGFENY